MLPRGGMWTASAFALAGALYACGDDEGSVGGTGNAGNAAVEGPRIETGIDSDTSIADLTPAEEQRLCDEVADAALDLLTHPRIVDGFCTAWGIGLSLLVAPAERDRVCTEVVASCTMPAGFPDLTVVGANCGQPSPTCDATVGEVEACNNALLAAFEAFYLDVSCSGLAQIQVAPVLPLPASECLAVQTRCPNLYPAQVATAPMGTATP